MLQASVSDYGKLQYLQTQDTREERYHMGTCRSSPAMIPGAQSAEQVIRSAGSGLDFSQIDRADHPLFKILHNQVLNS